MKWRLVSNSYRMKNVEIKKGVGIRMINPENLR